MYSCADTKETREKQLNMLLDGETEGLKDDCQRDDEIKAQPLMMANTLLDQDSQAGQTYLQNLVHLRSESSVAHNEELEQEGDFRATETTTEDPSEFIFCGRLLFRLVYCNSAVLCCFACYQGAVSSCDMLWSVLLCSVICF